MHGLGQRFLNRGSPTILLGLSIHTLFNAIIIKELLKMLVQYRRSLQPRKDRKPLV